MVNVQTGHVGVCDVYLTPELLSLVLLLPHRLLLHAQTLNHTACFTCHLINQATHLIILLPVQEQPISLKHQDKRGARSRWQHSYIAGLCMESCQHSNEIVSVMKLATNEATINGSGVLSRQHSKGTDAELLQNCQLRRFTCIAGDTAQLKGFAISNMSIWASSVQLCTCSPTT